MRESTVVIQWQAEACRADLLGVLQARFPGDLPPDLVAAIQENTDPAGLRRWLILAATAESLDAFLAAIQQPGEAGAGGWDHAGIDGHP